MLVHLPLLALCFHATTSWEPYPQAPTAQRGLLLCVLLGGRSRGAVVFVPARCVAPLSSVLCRWWRHSTVRCFILLRSWHCAAGLVGSTAQSALSLASFTSRRPPPYSRQHHSSVPFSTSRSWRHHLVVVVVVATLTPQAQQTPAPLAPPHLSHDNKQQARHLQHDT